MKSRGGGGQSQARAFRKGKALLSRPSWEVLCLFSHEITKLVTVFSQQSQSHRDECVISFKLRIIIYAQKRKRQSLESSRKIKQQMLKRSGAQLPAQSLAGSSLGRLFPLILQGKSKLPLATDEAEMGVSGGIFIRIYPRLLGRPVAYLQGFNGNHSTFLRSRGRRHPGRRRDGFQEMDTFSCYLSLSLSLTFPGCLDGVLLRFTRGHVLANVDGPQQHSDPLLTRSTPSQIALAKSCLARAALCVTKPTLS